VTPTISTTVYDASTKKALGSVSVGVSVYDTATVAGTVGGFVPSGKVTYNFFKNGSCSGTPASTGQVTLDASGNVPNSAQQGPLGAGSYSFNATYNDDSNYNASLTGDCEPFSVSKVTPTISTTVFDASTNKALGTLSIGMKVYDTAKLSGQISGTPATGKVTYNFFKNGTCSGTPASTGQVTLDASGNVPNSSTQGPLGAGSYSYNAVYNDDANYNSSATGDCEPFIIPKVTPTISTVVYDASTNQPLTAGTVAVGGKVYDTATLGGTVSGFTPTGTVTYQFFSNINCSGTPLSSDPVTLAGGVVPHSPTKGPLASGAYSFQATYNDDANYNSSAAGACEPFQTGTPQLTPGYWKNHLSQSEALILANEKFYIGNFVINGTTQNVGGLVTQIFNNMNCSNSSAQNAIGCLAGQLLAARLNIANGAPNTIGSTIMDAQLFLGITGSATLVGPYDGLSAMGVVYTGPTWTVPKTGLTPGQRALALALTNDLSAYNASGV
jgi:hypothetical protein